MPEREAVLACGGQIRFLPLHPGRSTSDLIARILGEIPVGVVTAVIGAPFFLVLLRQTRSAYEL